MDFDHVLGQERVKRILESSYRRGRLSHAYLFYGPAGCGMDAKAVAMGLTLLCKEKQLGGCGVCSECSRLLDIEHPAFRLVWPIPAKPKALKSDKYQEILRERALHHVKNPYQEISFNPEISGLPIIGIDQIRTLKKNVILKLSENAYRILLISSADTMTTAASNSLLKLLEEPPDKTILFLTSSSHTRMLPTILSRCQHVRFSPLGVGEIEDALINRWNIAKERAGFLAHLSGGSMTRALSLNDDEIEKQRDAAFLFLQQSLERDTLLSFEAAPILIREWDKTGMQSVLRYLRYFLRDWMHLAEEHQIRLINFDYANQIRELMSHYPDFDPKVAIGHVGRAIDFIEKNVYLQLIIQNLNMDLNACNIR